MVVCENGEQYCYCQVSTKWSYGNRRVAMRICRIGTSQDMQAGSRVEVNEMSGSIDGRRGVGIPHGDIKDD